MLQHAHVPFPQSHHLGRLGVTQPVHKAVAVEDFCPFRTFFCSTNTGFML